MALEMKVPSPGESITEVEIAQWLVEDGDYVEKDQAIAEVDSDKATLELPAEASGIITLKAEEGDVVAVGEVVCLIDTEAAKPDTESKEEQPKEEKKEEKKKDSEVETSKKETTYASGTPSPAANKIMQEKGIQSNTISGTGKDGRITKQDAVEATPSMGTPGSGSRNSSTKRMSMLRRRVAERLVSVKNETAMLTTFNEVDMTEIFALRTKYKDRFRAKHGVNLGFMSFFTLAVVRALELYPEV